MAWLNTNLGYDDLPLLCSCKHYATFDTPVAFYRYSRGWPNVVLWVTPPTPSSQCWGSAANDLWQPLLDYMRRETREWRAKTGYGILWMEEM